MAKFKSAKTNTQGAAYNNGTALKGGLTSLTGNQIQIRVKIGDNAEANGSIIRAKGSKKFYVTDGTNYGTCTLADLANAALTANTMTVTCTKQGGATFRASRINNKFAWDQSNNKYLVGTAGSTATDPDTVAVARA